ncbi:tetratricopeptide repeat protein 19 homolog, mitochondrial-like [Uloborus diversus]|uniref:tetratricopeptide repeat protein 19 homolog, mitochondrial-like n=1 Tax=Uloborus diversus TaxID=327109 RepID=UPI00240A833B|nr:tetratricopeptide repeat protein 19 homolog, mitochondrial-like [Uloborus diversus]
MSISFCKRIFPSGVHVINSIRFCQLNGEYAQLKLRSISAAAFRLYRSHRSRFRPSQRELLFAGILTWLGFKEEKEDTLITIMKRGILCLQREEYDKAENILHLALKIAQERKDMDAQRYVFDLLANVAFEKGDYPKAEKLFLQVLKELLAIGKQQTDNAVIEISLKLAKIYSLTSQSEKALSGFKFCMDTQANKVKDIDMSDAQELSDIDKDTVLLHAWSMEWYAKYVLVAAGLLKDALQYYEKAIDISEKINGTNHPQTITLLNDIGTVLTSMKDYESAITKFEKAIHSSKELDDKSDVPVYYFNLGCLFTNIGEIDKGEKACKMALKLAKKMKIDKAIKEAEICLEDIKEKRYL